MQTETITSADGTKLHALGSDRPGPRGALVILHGYGEHLGRYAQVVDHLAGLGFSCYLVDLRGHGRSPGRRGHVGRWSEYWDDVDALLALVKQREGGRRPLLLGHSMGGLVAISYCLARGAPGPGLILSAPFLDLATPPPALRVGLALVMSRLFPAYSQPTALAHQGLSHDPQVVAAYESDPLVHRVASAGWFAQSREAQALCRQGAERLEVDSLLLMYGQDDGIASTRAMDDFYQRLQVADRTRLSYPGLYHEIFNELERDQVLDDLGAWLGQRWGSAEAGPGDGS